MPLLSKELNKLSVADFTAASISASTSHGTGSLPTVEVLSAPHETFMDLDVVPSKCVPPLPEAGDASSIKKTAAAPIGDKATSNPAASHAVRAFYAA